MVEKPLMQLSLEKLVIYRCASCDQVYFFALDVADHKKETGHEDFTKIDPDLD